MKLFWEQRGVCNLCDVPMLDDAWQCDHIKPLCDGGSNEAAHSLKTNKALRTLSSMIRGSVRRRQCSGAQALPFQEAHTPAPLH